MQLIFNDFLLVSGMYNQGINVKHSEHILYKSKSTLDGAFIISNDKSTEKRKAGIAKC